MPSIEELQADPDFQKLDDKSKQNVMLALKVEGSSDSAMQPNRARGVTLNDIRNGGIELARPILSGMAGTAAGGVSGPLAIPAAVGAYTLTDSALQALKSDAPSSVTESLVNTGLNAVGGKITGKITQAIPVIAKSGYGTFMEKVMKKPPVPQPDALLTTVSQKLEPGFLQSFSSWIEDAFAPGAKQAAIDASTDVANKKLKNIAFRESGNSPLVNASRPDTFVNSVVDRAKTQLVHINDAATENADAFRMVAGKNVVGLNPINTGQLTGGPLASSAPMEGPILLLHGAQKLQDFLQKIQSQIVGSAGVPDNLKGPINEAQGVLKSLGAVFDPQTGAVTNIQKVSADQAWKIQQKIGDVTFTQGSNKELSQAYHAITDDMEDSIKLWKNDPGGVGLRSFQNAKALTNTKYTQFLNSKTAPTVSTMVEDVRGSRIPLFDQVLDDPNKLKEVLASGKLPIPSPNGNITISDSKMDKGFAGYMLDKIRNQMFTPTVMDPNRGVFNGTGAIAEWNKEGNKEVKDLLYSPSTQSNINQLFKEMMMLDKKGGSTIGGLVMRAGRAGFIIPAASIAAGAFTPYTAMGLMTGGLMLSGSALAHLMTNKESARLMIQMARGGPLGMSQNAAGRIIREGIKNAPLGMINAGNEVNWGNFNEKGDWKERD